MPGPVKTMGELTFAEGQNIFRQQTPVPAGLPYRTVRWGRDLQVWIVEGRDFRSANTMADGPAKTIWGAGTKSVVQENRVRERCHVENSDFTDAAGWS